MRKILLILLFAVSRLFAHEVCLQQLLKTPENLKALRRAQACLEDSILTIGSLQSFEGIKSYLKERYEMRIDSPKVAQFVIESKNDGLHDCKTLLTIAHTKGFCMLSQDKIYQLSTSVYLMLIIPFAILIATIMASITREKSIKFLPIRAFLLMYFMGSSKN